MTGAEREDERLLARAEEALTQIKVSSGLSEQHEAVLAALRIRLKGDAGRSLEDLLAAAEGPASGAGLDKVIERAGSKPATSFDELLAKAERPKPSLEELLGSAVAEPDDPDPGP